MQLASPLRKSPPRKAHSISSLCLLLSAVTSSFAQVPAPFIGTWKAAWQTEKKSYEAEFSISDSGGQWQTATSNSNNPCVGREVPMKLESTSDHSAQFVLQFSEVLIGCQNVTVTMKTGPDGTVTGTRSKIELTLTKKK